MRYEKIDIIRGIAIVLMVIFHLNYSLLNIFGINFLNFSSNFWFIIGKIAVLLFISISGVSFYLASQKYKEKIYKKYLKYSLFLGIIAIFITLFTYFFIKSQLILFGILHFFAISFLLILVFYRLKYYNFIIGSFIILLPFFINMETSFHYLFFLGFYNSSFSSADYYPIIPYFGVFLLSYSFSILLDEKGFFEKIFGGNKNGATSNFFKYIGKNSLLIYIIHQPIIIFLIYIILMIF